MVGEPLASVLRSGRELFNAKFAQARRRYPNLEAQVFSAFLISTIDPLARALSLPSEDLSFFIQSAYDAALELSGEGLLNGNAAASVFSQAWLAILPRLPISVIGSGEVVLGSISNAVHNLARARGARPQDWIREMAAMAPEFQTLEEFLQVGQIVGWRSGLAQYRRGALELVAQLREPLVRSVLNIRTGIATAAAVERLRSDVWYDPSGDNDAAAPRAVRRVGSFRGFGGGFVVPPTVIASGEQLFVSSGADTWLLIADVFGDSLHRVTAQEFESAKARSTSDLALQVSATQVVVDKKETAISLPGTVTSYAALPHTVAVTSSLTHAVQLIAR